MLHQVLSFGQKVALVLLQVGVIVVQLGQMPSGNGASSTSTTTMAGYLAGLAAVIAAGCSSGFASVFFERMLKANIVRDRGDLSSSSSSLSSSSSSSLSLPSPSSSSPSPSSSSSLLPTTTVRVAAAAPQSLWIRNVQLGLFAIVISACGMLSDSQSIAEHGLLHGYDAGVWFVVVNSSAGGLLVAAVVSTAKKQKKNIKRKQ